jgi:TolB protein
MDDLQARFRRLDRVNAPDLWNEAVGRAAELELAQRRRFNPGFALIAVALLLAALAGTIAVGALLNREIPQPVNLEYDNGWLTLQDPCGRVIGLDATTFAPQELVAATVDCSSDNSYVWSSGVAWTPDGRWMAYFGALERGENPGIWLYDARSEETRFVGECRYCYGIDISPDGSLIATAGGGTLAIVEANGGATHTLDLVGVHSVPQFSPDGGALAFTVYGGKTGVHVIDVTDVIEGIVSGPTMIHGIVSAYGATWSPDGDWIAFLREKSNPKSVPNDSTAYSVDRPTSATLWVVRRDGSGARQLSAAVGDVYTTPTWSPDSTTIAFTTGAGGAMDNALWTVGIDGAPPIKIYESSGYLSDRPAWSPDGEWIAFDVGAESPDESGLLVVRPDGTDAQFVSDQTLIPIWQPIPAD